MGLKHHTTSQGDVAYFQRGMGDPLLLVHGIYPGASHDEFHHNIDALARQYTIYAIDLLGFGDSDMPRLTYTAQTYQNLLREFIVEVIGQTAPIIASGISCGPVVSLAVYNDLLVTKMALIDPAVDPSHTDAPPPIAAKVQQFLLGTLSLGRGIYDTISEKHELNRFLRTRYSNPKHVTPQRVEALHDRARQRHAMHAIISNMTGHLALDVPRWLRYVRCETLILWGQHAGLDPTEKLIRPAAWSRGIRIEIIPDAGHWPHDEQSAKVNKLILEFLE
jgi:pimeloyl-ACP methyl ester carboxylesterase